MRKAGFASKRLWVGFCGIAFAFETAMPAQQAIVPRTDAQAQARTVWDMERVGAAMFSWLTDQVGRGAARPSQHSDALAATTVDLDDFPVISHADLVNLLVPVYIQEIPELDGWGHPFDFRLNVAQPGALHVLGIRSGGRDGGFSGSTYTVGRFDPASFDEDLVWTDGFATHWPAIVLSGREAQKKTVADVRNVGGAMFSWLADQIGRPAPAGSLDLKAATVNFADYPVIARADLINLLVPQYLQEVPELDGWGHPYDYRLNLADLLASEVVAVRSTGRDGTYSGDTYLAATFDPNLFDEDIVWADGLSVRSPGPLLGLAFFTLSPCRVFDTRPFSALPSGSDSLFEIGAICGIPNSAKAVVVNVTVVGPTGAGYVTLFPFSLRLPASSTINFGIGQTRGNNAILGVTNDRGIGSIEAQPVVGGNGHVHLILDVVGFFE